MKFSVHTLLLLIAGVALALGWELHIVHRRRDALHYLTAKGAFVDLSEESREGCREIAAVAAGDPDDIEFERWSRREAARPGFVRRWMGDIDIVILHPPCGLTAEEDRLLDQVFPEAVITSLPLGCDGGEKRGAGRHR